MSLQHCNTMKLNFGLYHYKNAILVNTSINIYNIKGQMQTKWHIPSYLMQTKWHILCYPLQKTCDAIRNMKNTFGSFFTDSCRNTTANL
jgi:hypothetical protein